MLHKDVVPGIHRIEQAYTNFYIVEGTDGLTIVDTGLPSGWKLLLRALDDLEFTRGDIKAVIITHAHFDHLGFASRAKADLNVPVFIHKNDTYIARHPYRYDHEKNRFLTPFAHPGALKVMAALVKAGALNVSGIDAVETFNDEQTLDVPGTPRVFEVPGHTYGECAFLFEEHGALLTGDALVTLNPYTGKTGPQIISGAATADSTQALASLKRLVGSGESIILPGHGEPWTRGVAEAVSLALQHGTS